MNFEMENFFDSLFRTFLTRRGKYEDEDEKAWENEFDFGISHIKIRLCASFLKVREKNF